MGEEQARYEVKLEDRLSDLEQNTAEHRHWRDPEWDLWTRVVNRFARTSWDDHFRSGVIPAGYAWQGAPFGGAPGGAGGTLIYDWQSTYLRVACDATPHFLSRAVGTFADKFFIARMDTGNGTIVGIRADDGTNNNYAEHYLNPGNNNTVQVTFTFVTGGGAPVTAASPATRSDNPYVLMLFFNNAAPSFIGYTNRESGRWDANNLHTTGVIGWVPTRIGLIFRNNLGFSACVDFIDNQYV